MTDKLLPLSTEEREAVLEMRDLKLSAIDAGHMTRILIALLRGKELDACQDSAEWLANRLSVVTDRFEDHFKEAP